jgi:hypothetical protein
MPSITISILTDAARARRELRETGDAADDLGKHVGGMGLAIGAGVAAGAAALFKLGADAWAAAEESAKIGRETERVIRTTGAAAWTGADAVGALAGAISDKTGADDEAVQSGANLLLTFTNVKNAVGDGNDVFDQATGLALDMATALGTDISGASIQLGKALNDPIKGITALSKAGVSFTAEQKQQIRTMVESGDVLGAQKVVLAELAKEFGGAAEAAGTPVDKLKVAIGNVQEELGAKLIPAVSTAATFLLDRLGPAFEGATAFVSEHGEAIKVLAIGGFVALAGAYVPVLAAQAALVAANVAGFFTSMAGSVVYAAQAYLTVAASQGVLAASSQALAYALASPAAALIAITAAVYAVSAIMDQSSEDADKFWASLQEDVDTSSFDSLVAASRAVDVETSQLKQNLHDMGFGDLAAGVADILIPFHDVENSMDDQQSKLAALNEKQREYDEKVRASDLALRAFAETNVYAARGIDASKGSLATFTAEGKAVGAEVDAMNTRLRAIAESQKIDLTAPGAVDKVKALYAETQHVTTGTLGMSDAQEKYNDAAATAKDKVDAYKQSLDALVGVHISAAQAETSYSQNLLTTAKTLGENALAAAGLTDVTASSSLAQTVAINANNKAIQDNVKSALDLANATYQETGSLDLASASLMANRDQLIATMVQSGYTEEAARAYIDRLGLTPAAINTQVNLDAEGAKGDLQYIDGRYQVVRGGAHGRVTVDVEQAKRDMERLIELYGEARAQEFASEDRRLEARARMAGGPVSAYSAYIVGEAGPELFIPGRSGFIVPNGGLGTSTAVASQNTFNVTVVSTGLGADSPQIQRDVVAALRAYEHRNGPVLAGTG